MSEWCVPATPVTPANLAVTTLPQSFGSLWVVGGWGDGWLVRTTIRSSVLVYSLFCSVLFCSVLFCSVVWCVPCSVSCV